MDDANAVSIDNAAIATAVATSVPGDVGTKDEKFIFSELHLTGTVKKVEQSEQVVNEEDYFGRCSWKNRGGSGDFRGRIC